MQARREHAPCVEWRVELIKESGVLVHVHRPKTLYRDHYALANEQKDESHEHCHDRHFEVFDMHLRKMLPNWHCTIISDRIMGLEGFGCTPLYHLK
jgi:hypothetical protein